MDILLNAKVECTDGPCGESMAVVVDPVTKELTHLVVHYDEMRPPPERLVPVELVVETTHQLIRLECTSDEVARMAPFFATRYIAKETPDYSPYTGGEETTEWYHPHATMVGTYPKIRSKPPSRGRCPPSGTGALSRFLDRF